MICFTNRFFSPKFCYFFKFW